MSDKVKWSINYTSDNNIKKRVSEKRDLFFCFSEKKDNFFLFFLKILLLLVF